MDLTVGGIVWARRNKDEIYWPGKITLMSSNTNNDLWMSELLTTFQQEQPYNYLVQFFVNNQSIWTTDLLAYCQNRDCMTNESFIDHGLHPTAKQDFLNAIHQADYASNYHAYTLRSNPTYTTTMTSQQPPQLNLTPTIEDNIDSDFLLAPPSIFRSRTEYDRLTYEQTSASSSSLQTTTLTRQPLEIFSTDIIKPNQAITTNDEWYTQQGLLVESITPPLPSSNDDQQKDISSSNRLLSIDSVVMITTKGNAHSPFISYLLTCLSTHFHPSIICIDHLTSYQHPRTPTVSYLICLDRFDATIQQTLNSTILNNLSVHINYLFLVINAPSHELVKHMYATVIDKRTVIIGHYQSSFENEAVLTCSGYRRTFEMARSSLLKYLCPMVKYIESRDDEEEQLYSSYCVSSIVESTTVLNHFINQQIRQTLNENFSADFLGNNAHVINDLFPSVSTARAVNPNHLVQFINTFAEDTLHNRPKQSRIMNDWFRNGAIKTHTPPPIWKYYVQNVLQEK